MKESAKPRSPKSVLRRRIIGALAVAAVIVLIDGFLIEPRMPVLTTYHVAIPNLPRELDGFRIVQLSDIHRRRAVPDYTIRKAVRIANSTHADVAVLTGDFVGKGRSNIEPCFDMLARLRTRHGSYATLGNHDHWGQLDAIRASIDKHHIKLLNNSSDEIAPGLYLVGIDDLWSGKPDLAKAFEGVDTDRAYVMLSHTPLAVDLFKGYRGLLITGHTHGGQVQLPFVPMERLPGLKGWKYIEGWYRVGDILMYVNRGVGMIVPPVRFRCRPEVTLYVLHRSGGSSTSVRGSRR